MNKALAVSRSAVCAFVLAGMVLFAGCSGGDKFGSDGGKSGNPKLSGEYRGKYVGFSLDDSPRLADRKEYDRVIVFSGKQFTLTDYPFYLGAIEAGYEGTWSDNDIWTCGLKDGLEVVDVIKSMGLFGRQIQNKRCKRVLNGTYSISGDKIEFVCSDGGIVVAPFSITENTVTIRGETYARSVK